MVVLLTGGSRGIGPVVAEALAKRGANITLVARSESGLRDVAKRLTEMGTEVLAMPVDLRESSQREQLLADAYFWCG
jgi:short-subunit dehydrogenase